MEQDKNYLDHRDIGRELDLFSFHEIAPGAPFWHNNGMIIFKELEKAIREINKKENYYEISTPILVKKEVFEKSGHWGHYRDNMFYFQNPRDENEMLVVKPMNCPESTYVFNSRVRSYRDLPLRLAEIGRLHRNELSGTLGGLFRVRQITMDDAHIYIEPEQVEEEIINIIKTIEKFYSKFGFKTTYVLATNVPDQERLGTIDDWKTAEESLERALKYSEVQYIKAKGEAAFYGPKVEAHLKDSQGRDWQMGTAQLDLVMLPKQFDISYTDEKGDRKMPWVIHRAVLGSFERFIGVLLEHTGGKLPTWLHPIQAVVLPVGENHKDYASEVAEKLRSEEIRVELFESDETIAKRVREAELQKVPYILVVGDEEKESGSVAVRKRSSKDQEKISIDDFIKNIGEEIKNRE